MAAVRRCKSPDCPQEAAPRVQYCEECRNRRGSPYARQQAAEARLAAVPEVARRPRVPEREWPAGRRWCGSCQTFVLLEDVAKGQARCKACASIAAHRTRIKSTFGLSPEDYQWLMDVQGGRCAICRCLPSKRRLAVDHRHGHTECGGKGCSGCVSGLCCVRCNHDLLGAANDSIRILRNAVAYLENPPMHGEWSRPQYEIDEWRARYGDSEPAPY